MAAKVTDESMAEALGYFMDKNIVTGNPMVRKPHKKYPDLPSTARAEKLPKFTTSLDAIVPEIEARGVCWIVACQFNGTYWASIRAKGMATIIEVTDATAPLALCAALLAFLKDSHAK